MCEDKGILTGFQVFYGTYDQGKAGSAHGNLGTTCKNTKIAGDFVWKVTFYGQDPNNVASGTQKIEGMEIVTQPFRDERYPGNTI